MLALISSAIFVAVSLLTAAILYPLLTKRTAIEDRLGKITPQKPEKHDFISPKTPLQDFLSRLGMKLPLRSGELTAQEKLIAAAGFRKRAYYVWAGCKVLLAVLLPGVFVFFYAIPKGVLLKTNSLLYASMLAIAGFLLPSLWLRRRVENRRREIFHALPDMLDLLTVCVEAGLSIDSAMVRTCEHAQFKGNPLAAEIKTASMETRAGKPRGEALRDMAERTMVDDVKSFVTMLVQTERFGTSLSQALRVYSDSLRKRRMQMAEESAAKTAVKMLFPLVFFIFPALLVVILGPAVFKLNNLFK